MQEEKKTIGSLDHRFVNFTSVFSQPESGLDYKIENIMLGITEFAAVLSHRSESLVETNPKDGDKKKVKLIPIDKILQKLQNSKVHQYEDFTIIYENRFEGNLEVDLILFLENQDIPTHRVRQVLKKGKVMWDRKEKINLI